MKVIKTITKILLSMTLLAFFMISLMPMKAMAAEETVALSYDSTTGMLSFPGDGVYYYGLFISENGEEPWCCCYYNNYKLNWEDQVTQFIFEDGTYVFQIFGFTEEGYRLHNSGAAVQSNAVTINYVKPLDSIGSPIISSIDVQNKWGDVQLFIEWNSIENAIGYNYKLYSDSSSVLGFIREATIGLRLSYMEPGKEYKVAVQACSNDINRYQDSDWNDYPGIITMDEAGSIYLNGEKIYSGSNEPVISPQEQQVRNFVERFYTEILGRKSEKAGLDNWTVALMAGTRGGADVAFEFIKSPEFQLKNETDEQYITRLYHAFFDREPDEPGMESWLKDIENGKDRDFILNGFLVSEEYKNLCKKYGIKRDSTRTFVRRFYKIILGRTDDQITPEELDVWQTALDAKALTGSDMARDWINTRPEFLQRELTEEEFVQIVYNVVFDRDADPTGLATWTGELKSGKTRAEVLDAILASPEFIDTCAEYGIEAGK